MLGKVYQLARRSAKAAKRKRQERRKESLGALKTTWQNRTKHPNEASGRNIRRTNRHQQATPADPQLWQGRNWTGLMTPVSGPVSAIFPRA
jgi:hypothetical protein